MVGIFISCVNPSGGFGGVCGGGDEHRSSCSDAASLTPLPLGVAALTDLYSH